MTTYLTYEDYTGQVSGPDRIKADITILEGARVEPIDEGSSKGDFFLHESELATYFDPASMAHHDAYHYGFIIPRIHVEQLAVEQDLKNMYREINNELRNGA